MNYAIFDRWVLDRVEDLVSFGVSRDEAEALMSAVQCGAVANEAANRADRQFLLDLRRVGTAALAQRHNVTPAAIRNRRAKILKTQVPLAPALAG